MMITGWVLWYIVVLLVFICFWVGRAVYIQETMEQDRELEYKQFLESIKHRRK